MKQILFCLLLILPGIAPAQKFWLTTYEFPGGPKTGIAALGDSLLFAGLTDGVLRSDNEGDNWQQILWASQIVSIQVTPDGTILAGGVGKIFISNDFGDSWDSVSLGHDYLVLRFAQLPNGHLFAITAGTDPNLGYVGAGVYCSVDQGLSWEQRNNGLNNYLSADQIAADADGRLYLTVRNELSNGEGGFFYSDNEGLWWQQMDIKIDGENVIENDILIHVTTGLSVTHQDSLYLCLDGVAGSSYVRLNLSKHLSDVDEPSQWNIMKAWNGATWWLDRPLNLVHVAQNGDAYSSVGGTIGFGGTFFRKAGANDWNRHLEGLGLTIFDDLGAQHFAELPNGKIFMIQYFDERIYWADTSQTTSFVVTPPAELPSWQMFPNPVAANSEIQVVLDSAGVQENVWLIDASGRILFKTIANTRQLRLPSPADPGAYVLIIGHSARQLIVH